MFVSQFLSANRNQITIKTHTHRAILRGLAAESSVESADSIPESANSTTDFTIVCRLSISNLGAYLGKGTYWQFFHKLDSRETSLLNAANHFKIFLIEFEICLYEYLYFLYIRKPLFPIVAFISMFWQLKFNMFNPKNSFPIV